ncbi:MAG: dipeptide/oligopeptide/nickel ABC transporter ATP-binding protein [Enterobacteriaceae bacterium]|jgi:ABC-type dipeptide/oligopeptide/nickel transport system ATPase subunit|nr:dipeptide/oligopeptide/nickel ABC transporter ATP-binding protein [Enterobacteriaceae bacterium]
MLECNNISKVYKKGNWFSAQQAAPVLNDVNFKMIAGRSMGLLGENGSGKSTLTRIILGLEKPTSGNVLFNGQDIHQMVQRGDQQFRQNMQAVFQDPASAMNPRWNALKIITEPLINFGSYSQEQRRDSAAKLMCSVDLNPSDMDKNITRFSGGQQQRICIARALALSPKLLILDEAVSNLDMVIQAQIIELLEQLKTTHNISLLLISHDIRVVFKLCEDILVLDKGNIAERISIETGIKNAHSDAFTRLVSCVS